MANPFDLISSELGIVHGGLPHDYVASLTAQQQQQQQRAVAANQELMMRSAGPNMGLSAPIGIRPPRRRQPESLEKVERRRKREREAARRSRQRKQSRVEDLESRTAILERENESLREQLKCSNVQGLLRERDELLDKLQAGLDALAQGDGSMESAIGPCLQAYSSVSDMIVTVNTQAAEAMNTALDHAHLNSIVLWMFKAADPSSMVGDDEHRDLMLKITSKVNDKVCEDIGMTQAQYQEIISSRVKYFDSFQAAFEQTQRAAALIAELEQQRASMAHSMNVVKSFREHILNKVLSDVQVAKLVIWMRRHQNLLDHLGATAANLANSAASAGSDAAPQ
ncbi:BZIP domain-containing protein [Plasmodiophora brassicae]